MAADRNQDVHPKYFDYFELTEIANQQTQGDLRPSLFCLKAGNTSPFQKVTRISLCESVPACCPRKRRASLLPGGGEPALRGQTLL